MMFTSVDQQFPKTSQAGQLVSQ